MSNGHPIIVPLASPDPATTDWVPLGPPGPGIPPAGATNQALVKNSGTDYDVKWGAAGADLIYDGDYASGPTYKDGEIVVYQGIAYICTMPTTSPPSAWPGGGAVTQPPATVTSYGVTLPTGPYDGQEAVLVDSITNPTYQWRFRWNAGSTSAYKWEYVGGAWFVQTPAAQNASAGSWSNPFGANAQLTVPRGGDYVATFTAYLNCAASLNVWVGLTAAAATSPNRLIVTTSSAAGYAFGHVEDRYTGLAAGRVGVVIEVAHREERDENEDCHRDQFLERGHGRSSPPAPSGGVLYGRGTSTPRRNVNIDWVADVSEV